MQRRPYLVHLGISGGSLHRHCMPQSRQVRTGLALPDHARERMPRASSRQVVSHRAEAEVIRQHVRPGHQEERSRNREKRPVDDQPLQMAIGLEPELAQGGLAAQQVVAQQARLLLGAVEPVALAGEQRRALPSLRDVLRVRERVLERRHRAEGRRATEGSVEEVARSDPEAPRREARSVRLGGERRRARAQAEAAVAEAEAALRHAEANVTRAEADLDFAENQYQRTRRLAEQGTIPQRMLDDATLELRTVRTALDAARSEVDRQRATLERARAQLVGPEVETGTTEPGECCVVIRAPATGAVLSIENVSARLVQAGEPLLTIGRPDELEIEVELLSSDAVRIQLGADAYIARWGGADELAARVRRIEPSAHTRISALGIEEQRVRVRLDLLNAPDERAGLGDNFRVFVRVVEWAEDEVLQVPIGALFRHGEEWAVYREVEGQAVLAPVSIGRRTATQAQVLEGLEAGERVVLFPGDRVSEGTRITDRAEM